MPTRFELEDLRVSRDADRLHGEPVVWRPMKMPAVGGAYTKDQIVVDPARPSPAEPLLGIVSWSPSVTNVTGSKMGTPTGSAIANIACTLDFGRAQFDALGIGVPRKGDVFEIPGEPSDTRYVTVIRAGNSTLNRISFHCSIANAP